jgi:hypothetical protein
MEAVGFGRASRERGTAASGVDGAGEGLPGGSATLEAMSAKKLDTVHLEDIGDFGHARAIRREAALALSMSERLARLNTLCKQMSAVKGAASVR